MARYDFRSPRLYVEAEFEAGATVALKRAQAHYLGTVLRLSAGKLFAPLKAARLDYVTQKAVEMGASLLQPVLTRHGQVTKVNTERMRANAIEAAEQCGILSPPAAAPLIALARLLAERDAGRWLVFCDEDAEVANPVDALSVVPPSPLAVLIGPEGGFAEDERAALLRQPNVVRLSLGPRILRADTAAVAALALVQAVVGDWR
jgi:16S rRNA (uracil1498-N3)-methyltransferase